MIPRVHNSMSACDVARMRLRTEEIPVREVPAGQVPELQTEPIRIWFHVAAEMATSLLLIVGGVGLFAARPWAMHVFRVSIGMLLYTAIVSPGYFAQQGNWYWTALFGVIVVLSILSERAVVLGHRQ